MVTAAGSAPAGVFVFVKAMLTVLVEVMVPVIIVFVKAVLAAFVEAMASVTMVFVKAVMAVFFQALAFLSVMVTEGRGCFTVSAERCLHWWHLFPGDGRQDFPFLPSGAYE